MVKTLRRSKATRRYVTIETPLGVFALIEDEGGRISTTWLATDRDRPAERGGRASLPAAGQDARPTEFDPDLRPREVELLKRYFAGEAIDFDEFDLPDGPPFYRACWRECRKIPRGQTWSYAQLARAAGAPRAARAAGQAMRHNRLPVVVPCHRVVGSDGGLHGFGGSCSPDSRFLDLKARLLRLEGAAV